MRASPVTHLPQKCLIQQERTSSGAARHLPLIGEGFWMRANPPWRTPCLAQSSCWKQQNRNPYIIACMRSHPHSHTGSSLFFLFHSYQIEVFRGWAREGVFFQKEPLPANFPVNNYKLSLAYIAAPMRPGSSRMLLRMGILRNTGWAKA